MYKLLMADGGDGVPAGGGTANPVPGQTMATAPEIPLQGDVSETPEQLEARINEELGLPAAPPSSEPAPEEPPEEPEEAPVVEEPAEDEEPEPVEEPTPAATPAEPSDELSIEVVDADGVTHKISSIEDLPEDFTPRNNRQIIEIVAQLTKLEGDIAARDARLAEEAAATELREAQDAQFAAWDAEVAALADQNRIKTTDTDRINEVFGYMREVNDARTKANNPNLITSFEDALDKFEAREAKAAQEAAKNKETELAKAKSSLIGRNSAAAGENYVYRSGQYRSIDDIPV